MSISYLARSDAITAAHHEALEWFVRHQGEVGPRPYGPNHPTDAPPSLRLAAQRGIHVPTRWRFALSINSTRASQYGDGEPLSLSDGTWLLPYAEHKGADGVGLSSRWNRGLAECWRARVPVGVHQQLKGGQYLNLGLAYVEDYDPGAGFFLLHGPVSLGTEDSRSIAEQAAEERLFQDSPEVVDSEEVRRTIGWVVSREDQAGFRDSLLAAYGYRCAISQFDVQESLQAAHILNYSGRSSQTLANGLLLRADLHLLFDRHLLAIEPTEMRVHLAPAIRGSRYASLHSAPVRAPSFAVQQPSAAGLGVHFEVSSRAWA